MDITQRIAQIIRRVDGRHSMGAAALAEAIVAELRLTRETSHHHEATFDRYVTNWVPA